MVLLQRIKICEVVEATISFHASMVQIWFYFVGVVQTSSNPFVYFSEYEVLLVQLIVCRLQSPFRDDSKLRIISIKKKNPNFK